MDGQDVVTSDDHKIGTIVAEQDGFAIVEMGHVFKSKHAIPIEFLHDVGKQHRLRGFPVAAPGKRVGSKLHRHRQHVLSGRRE